MSFALHLGHHSHSVIKNFIRTYSLHSRYRASIKQEQLEEDNIVSQHPYYAHTASSEFDMARGPAMTPAQASIPSTGSTVRKDDDDITMDNGTLDDRTEERELRASTSAFAQTPRRLITTIQKLGALGIDATLPSLPKIIVVGDQSHGKSSVIEAVCDISMPRDAGTCTRCPFELVTTASSGAWTCKISLVLRYESSPAKWRHLNTPEIVQFAQVKDQRDLERLLRLAQIAILSPSRDPIAIRDSNDIYQDTTLGFSPNIIRIEIASPELPELSLYDLPGAINVTENPEDQHLVNFVETLLTGYVKDEKAIVLLTAAVNADVELCKAFNIIRQQNASHRCMGVITKPDLMEINSTLRVRKMLNGDAWDVGHGWFVTKQLSQEELTAGDISHAKARELESVLFSSEPWSGLPFPDRFGILNLQNALSQKLTEHILNDLPEIYERVQVKVHEVDAELAGFPERSLVPCMEVLSEIDRVTQAIVESIRGDTESNEFREGYKSFLKTLEDRFKNVRPQLTLISPDYKEPAISIDSDDETEQASPTPAPSSSKSRKGNDGRAIPTPMRNARTPIKMEKANKAEDIKVVFNLKQIRRAYEIGNNGGLPDLLSVTVTERLTLKCLQGSRDIITQTLDGIRTFMIKYLTDNVRTTLASRRGTKLIDEATKIVESLFREHFRAEREAILSMLACELHKPLTSDGASVSKKQNEKKAELHKARDFRRVNEHYDTIDANKQFKNTNREQRKKLSQDPGWMNANLGPDSERLLIDAIAGPLVYYDVATARMTDVLRMRLEYGVFYALEQRTRNSLREGLNVTNTEHCAKLLAEDPAREKRRRDLMAEKAKLHEALEELQSCRSSVED